MNNIKLSLMDTNHQIRYVILVKWEDIYWLQVATLLFLLPGFLWLYMGVTWQWDWYIEGNQEVNHAIQVGSGRDD